MGRSLGGISDLRRGLSFHKLWLRVLGPVTNRAVPRSPALRNGDATARASAGKWLRSSREPRDGSSPIPTYFLSLSHG